MKQFESSNESPLFRNTRLCLTLLGSVCLATAGVMAVRWSLKYTGVGKFTAMGVLCIVLAAALMMRTTQEAFRKKRESNKEPEATR